MSTRTNRLDAGFDVDASLGYVVGRLSKLMTGAFNRRLAEHGITAVQWSVLACLWAEDGLAQKEISLRTGVDTATLAELLKRMTARGLVRRERDPANQRVQRVYLADADLALRDAVADLAAEVNAIALAGFGDSDQTRLLRLLRRAISNLDTNDRGDTA